MTTTNTTLETENYPEQTKDEPINPEGTPVRESLTQKRAKNASQPSSASQRSKKKYKRRMTGKGNSYKEENNESELNDASYDVTNLSISLITTRSKKSQRLRTCKSMAVDNTVSKKRNPWTAQEDETLLKLVKQHGKRWSVISKHMGTRTGKQIRDRYLNKFDPSVTATGEWTPQEDALFLKYWKKVGNRWSEIARHIDGRTESMVKNRYYSHFSKKQIKPREKRAKRKATKQEMSFSESHEIVPESNEAMEVQKESVLENHEWLRPALGQPEEQDPMPNTRTSKLFTPLFVGATDQKIPEERVEEEQDSNEPVEDELPDFFHEGMVQMPIESKNQFMVCSNRSSDSMNMLERFLSEKIDPQKIIQNLEFSCEGLYFDLPNFQANSKPLVPAREYEQRRSGIVAAEDLFDYPKQNWPREGDGDFSLPWPEKHFDNEHQNVENRSMYSVGIMKRFGEHELPENDEVSVSPREEIIESPSHKGKKLDMISNFNDKDWRDFVDLDL